VVDITANLKHTLTRIRTAEQKYGRPPGSVNLLAVSKSHPVDMLRQAIAAGQREFGENYVQEAIRKIAELGVARLVWHFIGPVQSNKTAMLAENFQWVHSVDRIKVARRLSDARPSALDPLNVCIQVNISGEQSKSGVAPDEAAVLAGDIAGLPKLRLRGLMVIPPPRADFNEQCAPFRAARILLEKLNNQGHELDTLSMGMSGDLEAAIAEGATVVRVGTAIFGARPA
jgi:pyridoxal phosphate enzyme (YggS family)